jgi:hypothetical protein
MYYKILNKKLREPKVSRLLPNVWKFQKESHTLSYGLKIYRKSHGFLFFVISISELYTTVYHLRDSYM